MCVRVCVRVCVCISVCVCVCVCVLCVACSLLFMAGFVCGLWYAYASTLENDNF